MGASLISTDEAQLENCPIMSYPHASSPGAFKLKDRRSTSTPFAQVSPLSRHFRRSGQSLQGHPLGTSRSWSSASLHPKTTHRHLRRVTSSPLRAASASSRRGSECPGDMAANIPGLGAGAGEEALTPLVGEQREGSRRGGGTKDWSLETPGEFLK